MLAGRAGGTVAGGTYIKTATAGQRLGAGVPNVGTVLLASLQAVGVPVKSVGNMEKNPAQFATTPLPGIIKGT